jgi:hypothetical protein
MGFSFLNPLFLVGMAALAVPVLVHLVQSHKGERLAFPSLMFLERVTFRTIRRAKIRNWVLFLIRAAAFALVVLAFARPILGSGAEDVLSSTGARDVLLLMDGSYSMAYGERWDRAADAARDVIDGLGRGDRAGIILFAEGAELVAPVSGDRGRLRAVLESLRPGDRATQFSPVLDLARQVLEDSEFPRREAVLISDFQRSGWKGDQAAQLPSWVRFTPIDVTERGFTNVSVASVRFQQRVLSEGARLTATARIVNRGGQSLSGQEVRLEINGVERGRRSVDLAEGGYASVTFEDIPLPASEARGTISVSEDRLPGDNLFNFVIDAGQSIRVLVVEGEAGQTGRSLYLEQALALGDRPSFAVEVVPAGRADANALRDRSMVVLNGVAAWGVRYAPQLVDFVERGGGLFVILGEEGRSGRSSQAADRLMPRTGTVPTEHPSLRGGALGEIDYDHPVFELFNTPHSGDFTTARFYRFQALADDWDGVALARYDDGSPALLEKHIGEGNVLVWTSTMDSYWNDLALQPIFLPFMHQVARHTVDYQEYQEWYTVGETLQLRWSGSEDADAVQARSPSRDLVELAQGSGSLLLSLEEPGFYEIQDPPAGLEGPRTIAVNRDPVESDLASMDLEEFELAATTGEPATTASGLEDAVNPEVAERRQSLWWYLLLTVGLLLGIETIASNRISQTEE